MKLFLILSIALVESYETAFSQCPQSGLKIQSPVCDSPRNLKDYAACETLHIKWEGNKDQTYIVTATYTDLATNRVIDAEAQQSCDNNGNCSATIPVKEGLNVNWSVQAICIINETTFYSPEVEGGETSIPYCRSIAENAEKAKTDKIIRVYPNPTTGYLTVEYYNKGAGTLEFKIYDMNGKMVFYKPGSAIIKAGNSYQLDLHSFISGAYLLEVSNGDDVSRAKFVLVRY